MEKNDKRRYFVKSAGIGSIGLVLLNLVPLKSLWSKTSKSDGLSTINTSKINVKINPKAVARNKGAKR